MAEFRKWFLAFAVVALLSGFAVPASAQLTPALQCVANAGVPPTVRAEGITELVGDITLNCTGGVPTIAGQPVAQANITVFLNTTITSRLLDSQNSSEALLLIDEPHSPSNPSVPLNLCGAVGFGGTNCGTTGTGNGVGVYNGTTGRPNAFVGRQTGTNQITWFGIPIDPPGTVSTRVIRATNIRGDASRLGVSSTLVPTQLTAFISITGSTSVPVNNPQQTVAFVQQGLTLSTSGTNFQFIQCVDANRSTALNPTSALATTSGQNGSQFSIRFNEGFGTAFKVRNISEVLNPNVSTYWAQNADFNQNVPGAIYNTEAGFQNNTVDPSPNPPNYTGPALTSINSGTWARSIGAADHGTRLMLSFASLPNGTSLFVPVRVNLVNSLTGATSGFAILTVTDQNGGNPFSAITATTPAPGGGAVTWAAVTSTGSGTAIAVYEVLQTDPFATETMTVPVAVAFVANVGNLLPVTGLQSTVNGSFAPLSTVNVASLSAPIPRFVPGLTPRNDFIINRCSCNMLFPFVSNQQGYDTGIAISNTSVDPFGTTPQQGTVTLNYYSGGTPPPAQTTNAPVPGGQQLLFTLSGGGNFGIAATPGFQGYIIAQAQFQFCHAFAYISAQGALPTSPGASMGYLGLILDPGGLVRTAQISESLNN